MRFSRIFFTFIRPYCTNLPSRKTMISEAESVEVPFPVPKSDQPSEGGNLDAKLTDNVPNYKFEGSRIDLWKGYPDKRCIEKCASMLQQASSDIMKNEELQKTCIHYGEKPGYSEFRRRLANFLTEHYGDRVKSENLVVTTGATMGLHLIASTLFNNSHPFFVEDPTYYHNIGVLSQDLPNTLVPVTHSLWNVEDPTYYHNIGVLSQDLPNTLVPVPMENDGIDLDKLEKQLCEHCTCIETCERYPWKALVYLIPVHHNPTGITYSTEKCHQIVSMATRHNVLLVCDDVYNVLTYDGLPPAQRLLHYDNTLSGGHVASLGTFTKYFSPGVRLGWIEAAAKITDKLITSGLFRSGGCLNHYMSVLMTNIIQRGLLSDHVSNIRKSYTGKLDAMVSLLGTQLPSYCSYTVPTGGYFIWIVLPRHVNACDLRSFAEEQYGISFMEGSRCSPTNRCDNCIRLCFTERTIDEIKAGVPRLCNAIAAYVNTTGVNADSGII